MNKDGKGSKGRKKIKQAVNAGRLYWKSKCVLFLLWLPCVWWMCVCCLFTSCNGVLQLQVPGWLLPRPVSHAQHAQ